MNFADLESAEEWLRHRPKSFKSVWTNDGVVVSFLMSQTSGNNRIYRGLSANLDLVCIKWQRPTRLAGATDSVINVTSMSGGGGVHECVRVGDDVIAKTWRDLTDFWNTWHRNEMSAR